MAHMFKGFFISLIVIFVTVINAIEDYKSGDVHFNAPPKFTMDMKDKYDRMPDKPNYTTKKKKPRQKKDKHKQMFVEVDQNNFVGNGELSEEEQAIERLKDIDKVEERRRRHEDSILEFQRTQEREEEEREKEMQKISRREQKARTPHEMRKRIDRLWKNAKKAGMDEESLANIRAELDVRKIHFPI